LYLDEPQGIRPTTPDETAQRCDYPLRWLFPAGARITSALPALASRDFRLFWFGQLISLTGTWVQSVAQQWLVLDLTHSAFALGLVTTVQFTPLLLLALLGGAIADRVPKRNLILATQVISCLLALSLGTLVKTGLAPGSHTHFRAPETLI